MSIMEVLSRNKLYLLSTISINSMSRDSETPRLIPNGPVSAQNGPIEDVANSRFSDDLVEDAGQFTIFVYFC